MSVAITTVGCSGTCDAICVQPHSHTSTYAAARTHARTRYENRQQLLDCVHGVDQHLSVLLVRQLLLPLFDHLRHFGHPWKRKKKVFVGATRGGGAETHVPKSLNFNRVLAQIHFHRASPCGHKCEKSLASDCLRLIKPQRPPGSIDLLPLMVEAA